MRKRFFGGLILAVVLSFSTATSARAQSWLGENICTMGGLTVCVSVNVVAPTQSGANLAFTVRNLFGIDPVAQSSVITAIGFYNLGSPWSGNVNEFWVGGVPSAVNLWNVEPPDNAPIASTTRPIDVALFTANGVNGGIEDGQLFTFELSLSPGFVFDSETHLRFHAQSIGDGPDEPSIKCDTGYWDGDSWAPCYNVPEPHTLALLGSGVFAVAAGAIRRRRKGLDIVDD